MDILDEYLAAKIAKYPRHPRHHVDKNVDNEVIDNNLSVNDQYHGCHAVEVIDKVINTVSIPNNER